MASFSFMKKNLFRYYKEFKRTVTSDLPAGEIKTGVRKDLKDLYHFYLDEDTQIRLSQMGRVRRWFWRLGWLLWNMLLRMTPIRRILFLLSFVLLIFVGNSFDNRHFTVNIHTSILSYIVLLIVLMLELKDKLLARDELAIGRAVQLALLPDDHPKLSGWDIWLFTRPANDVGGDLVDYIHFQDGSLGIMLGDVSGKGLGAALLMAKLQATLRAIATESMSPKELGDRANKILCRDGLPGRFVTLNYLRIEPDENKIQIMNAGHMPPIIGREDGCEELPPVSLPLGVKPDAVFFDQELDIAPGELLLAYSDGLSEARNSLGELFGEERVHDLVRRTRRMTAAEAGKIILNEVESFVGEERNEDDLSLAILKRN